MKIKTNKYTVRLRYITGTCRALLKFKKKKKLNMTGHKTDMDITKIEKYKKLNMREHKADMKITKIEK